MRKEEKRLWITKIDFYTKIPEIALTMWSLCFISVLSYLICCTVIVHMMLLIKEKNTHKQPKSQTKCQNVFWLMQSNSGVREGDKEKCTNVQFKLLFLLLPCLNASKFHVRGIVWPKKWSTALPNWDLKGLGSTWKEIFKVLILDRGR